jgi:alpha-tubulin suppressor-like RCC1 family protein
VICWGSNDSGQLGNGTTSDSSTPVAVNLPAGDKATAIAVAANSSCAILTNGSVTCWDYNGQGELGNGTTTSSSSPVPANLPNGQQATAVAAGTFHSCALLTNGSITC